MTAPRGLKWQLVTMEPKLVVVAVVVAVVVDF